MEKNLEISYDERIKTKIRNKIKKYNEFSWSFKMSEKLDKSTVTKNHIYILDNDNRRINIDVHFDDEKDVLVISPMGNYKEDMKYTLVITPDVKSIKGNHFKQALKIDFAISDKKILTRP